MIYKGRQFLLYLKPPFPLFKSSMSPVVIPSTTAAVLFGPRDIRIKEDRVLWHPSSDGPDHVQVKVVSTGLCGSDRTFSLSSLYPTMHAWTLSSTKRTQRFSLTSPHLQCTTLPMEEMAILLCAHRLCSGTRLPGLLPPSQLASPP